MKVRKYNSISEIRFLDAALEKTHKNNLLPEEKDWIDKIETLRKEMNASKEEINTVDYGAGSRFNKSLNSPSENEAIFVNKIIGEVGLTSSVPYVWSVFLFHLVREFKPLNCLELGTCLGISASFQAAALKLNNKGKIVTLEGAESFAKIAQQNIDSLCLNNVQITEGMFEHILENSFDWNGNVDYVFIDGHHEENAAISNFEKITNLLANRALIIIDDISWSGGMKRAWHQISKDPRVELSFNLRKLGICFISKKI